MANNGINTGDFNASPGNDFVETPEHDRDSGESPMPCGPFTGNIRRVGTAYTANGFHDGSLNLTGVPYNKTYTFTRLIHPYDEGLSGGLIIRGFDTTAFLPYGYGTSPFLYGFTYSGDPNYSPQYDTPIDWDGIIVPRVQPVVQGASPASLDWNTDGFFGWRISYGFYGGNPGPQCASKGNFGFEGMTSPQSVGISFAGIDGGVNAMITGPLGTAAPSPSANAVIAWAVGGIGTNNFLGFGQGQFQATQADYYLVGEFILYNDNSVKASAIAWQGYLNIGDVVSIGMPQLRFPDSDYVYGVAAPIGRYRFVLQSCNAYSFLSQNPTLAM